MRSLRDLDAGLARHEHLFGRRTEKKSLCKQLMSDGRGVLIHGSGGMGKTTLMLHALRDLGGAGGADLSDSGHSFYFEDLEAFVRFLGVRKRPVTLIRAAVTVKWDEGGERKERTVGLDGREVMELGSARSISLGGSSTMFQTDRLVVQVQVEAVIGPKFDSEEVGKLFRPALDRFSETLGSAIEDARADPGNERDAPVDVKRGAVPRRLAGALRGTFLGGIGEGEREHGIVLNYLEEAIGTIIEEHNREVYLSISSFLRTDDGPEKRLSLREFEDELQEFLENANLDRLVPGELTFWRWYVGIDHIERGVPGWTLDVKRQAVRMILEKLSEKDGFHIIMVMEPNPAPVFDGYGERVIRWPISMPSRDEFVRESSAFIVENVEDIGDLPRNKVQKAMVDLYDHCSGRIRLYYLVRNIKNLPGLFSQGVGSVEPDASFLDRQLGDALNQLGIRYGEDISIKNLPAVQPLLAMARIGVLPSDGSTIVSRNVIDWLLDAYDIQRSLGTDRYLGAMEAYGIVRVEGKGIEFYDRYVGWEAYLLANTMAASEQPIVASLRSLNRLNRMLGHLDVDDLLDISSYASGTLSTWFATSRADVDVHGMLLAAIDGGGDFPERRRKIAVLEAAAVLGGIPLPEQGDEKRRCADLMRRAAEDATPRLASLLAMALKRSAEVGGARSCPFCGAVMEEDHCICAGCEADLREACAQCGERISPQFAFCAGCGTKLDR
ncbi:MAG: hypothetical protein ISF22_06090 [Methanomassiliicoccus sp.]|nr:hypothetical protein [Methanomassiliicoccus sp.]